MNHLSSTPNTSGSVLYWEAVCKQEMLRIDKLMEAKCKRLAYLRQKLDEEMDSKVFYQIKSLEEEIHTILGLIDTTQSLKQAYLGETANVADLLTTLTCENQVLTEQTRLMNCAIELMLERSFTTQKKGENEH